MRTLSRRTSAIVVAGLVGGGLVAASDVTSPGPRSAASHDLSPTAGPGGHPAVEAVLSPAQARALAGRDVALGAPGAGPGRTRRRRRFPDLRRAGRHPCRDRAAGRRPPRHRRAGHDRPVRPGPGHRQVVEGDGTAGPWNAFDFVSGGWRDAAFHLSAYAGGPADVKVGYVANVDSAGKTGVGVCVDDTPVTTTRGTLDATGTTEGATSLWAPEGPPPGSRRNDRDFVISTELIPVASSVATEDTVLFGHGIEALATQEERASVLGAALRHLLG